MDKTLSVLALLLAASVWFDLRERRIPNKLVFPGLALGLLFALAEGGLASLGDRAAGAFGGLLIFLPFFALRLVGAGDAKLMAMVGAWVGLAPLLPISLYTFIAGGVLALIGLGLGRSVGAGFANLRDMLFAVGLRAHGAPIALDALGSRSAVRLPYAIAIAAGVVAWTVGQLGLR